MFMVISFSIVIFFFCDIYLAMIINIELFPIITSLSLYLYYVFGYEYTYLIIPYLWL
jgi:hypothetical protein